MKKILGLAVAAMMVMAMVGAGTWAFFSDTETVSGSIVAGTLDVTKGGTVTFALIDQSPGIPATTGIDLSLTNSSSIAGVLEISFSNLLNPENTRAQVETDAGDPDAVATSGELGGLVEIAVWIDPDYTGIWSTGDSYLPSDGSAAVAYSSGVVVPAAAWDPIDTFVAGGGWSAANVGVTIATGGGREDFIVEYRWVDSGDATDNIAQSDGVSFDIDFTVKQ